MKNYIVSFVDLTGSHVENVPAPDSVSAVMYIVNWRAWGQVTVESVTEAQQK